MDVHTTCDLGWFRPRSLRHLATEKKSQSWKLDKHKKKSVDGRFKEMMSLSGVLYIFCRVKLGQYKI